MEVVILDGSEAFCDKCGQLVPEHNDIRALESLRLGGGFPFVLLKARHCLPVEGDGVICCPGSPSRAQYLEGQPRDDRGYPYDKELETAYREAWRRLQNSIQ